MRIYELAKELGAPSKDLIKTLAGLNIEVKNHMSSIDADAIAKLRAAHGQAAPASAKPTTPVAEPVAAVEASAPVAEPIAAAKADAPQADAPAAPTGPVITLRGTIIVKELADKLGIKANLIIAQLMKMNVLASINERLEFDVASKIAEGFGATVEHEKRGSESKEAVAPQSAKPAAPAAAAESRAPVVTFLGHVDHGKTSLLDRIRSATVAKGESGGITQHIGAYTVATPSGHVTFLDTPGHAAFTAMRARGANLTDIAIIIIAADDGIMPQTKEAIAHAQAADVSLMVAINKCDLPAANPDRVLQQLQVEGLLAEEWGGETICCKVSAETGDGIDGLLEMIALQAEVLELKAVAKGPAKGFIIEAQLEPGRGPTATLLVTEGTLKVGDAVLCGAHSGRVRALMDDHGKNVKQAGPSTPVKVLGLSGVPEAGAEFNVYKNEREARRLAAAAAQAAKESSLVAPKKASLDDLFSQIDSQAELTLKVLLKADTQGSVEAITQSLHEIDSDKINLVIIHAGTGNITTNDVMLASASSAVTLGFHVGKENGVDALAKHEGVEIRLHQIIYELLDQVTAAMLGAIGPLFVERKRGRAEVRTTFDIGKTGRVAGCLMISGRTTPKLRVRVIRLEEVLYEGRIASLKHFQNEVGEIREAQECGIRIEGYADFTDGDILEFFELEQVEQTL